MNEKAQPAYEVWPMEREVTRNMCRPVSKKERDAGEAGIVMEKQTAVEKGFMVFYPRGHSQWLTPAALKAAGLDEPANMINMESGDVLGIAPTGLTTLRGRSLARNGKSKSGGIELQLSDLMNAGIQSIGDVVAEVVTEGENA